jgi:hypothetical protein
MQIDKFISYQIETQFPALYKESGKELIALVKSYYEFLEQNERQSTHNSRRLFEYRDIDSTLNELLVFFKNKYMKDLPLDENTIRLSLKRILNLYRRKGTEEGIELFFRMFYNENVKINYPSTSIFKPSDSVWTTEKYIQLYPTNPLNLKGTIGVEMFGGNTGASAIIENSFFTIVDGTLIPIIFVSRIQGNFIVNEDIFYNSNNTKVAIGRIYGSMSNVEIIDDPRFAKTNGHAPGDKTKIFGSGGIGGKLIVSKVTDTFKGEIDYTVIDGGWGYSREHTLLLASNQVIFLPELNPKQYEPFEQLSDQLGNTGIVIGQRGNILGVKMDVGSEFITTSVILDENSDEVVYDDIGEKNDTTPGPLLPEFPLEDFPVQVESLDNSQTIFIIDDIIGNFLNVPLNSANFNDPPALLEMSGTEDPVTLSTIMTSAFEIKTIEIGTIENFIFTRPGDGIINDVFAIAYDPVIESFGYGSQILTFAPSIQVPNAFVFRVGTIVRQGPVYGRILEVGEFHIKVRMYSTGKFDYNFPILYNGINYNIAGDQKDYSLPSDLGGNNAQMRTSLSFIDSQMEVLNVVNAGYGYANNAIVTILDKNDIPAARAKIIVSAVGETEGKWISYNSHLNSEFNKRLQDSFYYQAYSYDIKSKLDINTYEKTYKDIMHTAGTKFFGSFEYEDTIGSEPLINIVVVEQ